MKAKRKKIVLKDDGHMKGPVLTHMREVAYGSAMQNHIHSVLHRPARHVDEMADKITQRIIVFNSEAVQSNCIMLMRNLPVDGSVEIVIRKASKERTPDQNAAMWAGPMRDIEEQAWVKGRQYKADVWHEHFKREFLPEGDEDDFDKLVKHGYRKWDYTPKGDRVLVGSTTQLTTRGMAQYVTKLEAYAQTELGVRLSVNPKQMQGAGND